MLHHISRLRRAVGAALLAFATLTLLAGPARAHPHVWVTATAALAFDPEGRVSAIRHRWVFDKAFSAYATQGLDKNGDGQTTPDELAGLAKENLDGLIEFGWFSKLKVDGAKAEFTPPQGGAMELVDGSLVLSFVLPLEKPLSPGKALMLDISDPTYFVAFSIGDGPDAIALDKGPSGCVTSVTRPKAPPPSGAKLTEDFFNALSPASNYGSQFANKVIVACP